MEQPPPTRGGRTSQLLHKELIAVSALGSDAVAVAALLKKASRDDGVVGYLEKEKDVRHQLTFRRLSSDESSSFAAPLHSLYPKLFLSHSYLEPSYSCSPLVLAIMMGRTDAFFELLNDKGLGDEKPLSKSVLFGRIREDWPNALEIAAFFGEMDILKALVAAGCPVRGPHTEVLQRLNHRPHRAVVETQNDGDCEALDVDLAHPVQEDPLKVPTKATLPLSMAARGHRKDALRYLLQVGADPDETGSADVIIIAMHRLVRRITKFGYSNLVRPDARYLETVPGLIFDGSRRRLTDMVPRDWTAEDRMSVFALMFAQDGEAAEILLSHGAKLHKRTFTGYTALMAACFYGHFSTVKLLLDWGSCVTQSTYNNVTALHIAKTRAIAELLIGRGFYDEVRTFSRGLTPFLVAVLFCRLDVVKYLIELNSDNVNSRNYDGESALHFAGTPEIANILLSSGGSVNCKSANGWTPLHGASHFGKAEVVKCLLSAGADVFETSITGETPLHLASSEAIVELLVENGADVNCRSKSGMTPLHYSSFFGRLPVVEKLLHYHAKTCVFDDKGRSPLYLTESEKIVDVLVKSGMSVELCKHRCWTPIFSASFHGHAAVCRRLIDSGAVIHIVDAAGHSPLHVAATSEVAALLVSQGLDIEARSTLGHTPLHTMAINGYLDSFQYLIRQGADVNALSNGGFSTFHFCSTDLIAAELYRHTVDVNKRSAKGRTPLHVASAFGLTKVVEFFCRIKEVLVDVVDEDGNTALHCAINGKISSLLLERGVDVNIRNRKGLTPLHCAMEGRHVDVVSSILKSDKLVNIEMKTEDGMSPLGVALSSVEKGDNDNILLIWPVVREYLSCSGANLPPGEGMDWAHAIIHWQKNKDLFRSCPNDFKAAIKVIVLLCITKNTSGFVSLNPDLMEYILSLVTNVWDTSASLKSVVQGRQGDHVS